MYDEIYQEYIRSVLGYPEKQPLYQNGMYNLNYDNFNYIIAVLYKTVNRTKHRIFNNLDTTYLFRISFFQLCKLFRNSVGHFILFFSCINIRDSNDHCANNCIGASIQNCIIKTVQVLTTSFSILQRAIYLDCTTSVCSFGYRRVSIHIDPTKRE